LKTSALTSTWNGGPKSYPQITQIPQTKKRFKS
jgi:hypothetical protein